MLGHREPVDSQVMLVYQGQQDPLDSPGVLGLVGPADHQGPQAHRGLTEIKDLLHQMVNQDQQDH